MIFATLLITPNLTFGHLSSGNTAASCQRGVGNAKLACELTAVSFLTKHFALNTFA